jgi:hypothetical protein
MSELKWIRPSERKPGSRGRVLAAVKFHLSGKVLPITAKYVWRHTEEAVLDSDHYEYDDEEDVYWTPEGWYETIDNWGDFSAAAVTEGDVIAWAEVDIPVSLVLGD